MNRSSEREQMPDRLPAGLGRLDDPCGIIWRVANLAKRFSLAKVAAGEVATTK
jgi:hypothetical protein